MKKILLSMLAVILMVGLNAQSWNYSSSTGTSFILFGMSFPPGQSDIGYACGMEYTYNADGVIIKTTDGGDNWTEVWPVSGTVDGLQGIWFINDNLGFAGGWNNYFIKTTDGGATWTPVSCGTNVWYYVDVVFWDANNGVAGAYMNSTAQSVFITSDGGNTWTAATSGINENIMGLCYADQNTLFAVNTAGKVFKSTDGGHNWTVKATLPALLFGVGFADANFGVVGGEEKIFATNDGGTTWTTYTTGYENFYATQAFTDGTAYVGGTDERIHVTYDYGNTWTLEHNGAGSSHLYRIRYTPNGTFTACGSQGTIIQKAPVLTASFSADNTDVCEDDVVNFTDQSTGAVASWSWSFEGGSPATSTVQNPSITYNTSGTYDVTLEVSDGTIYHSNTETDYIFVEAIPSQATTPLGPDEVCGGSTVDYTTTAVAGADNYFWAVDPSDAGTITGTGITGSFTAATDWTGPYTVKVRAENECGNGAYSPTLAATLFHNPTIYFITGGGGYCIGSSGRELFLDGSETGVDYELYLDDITTGIVMAGTGDSLNFGYHTDPGFYSITGFTDHCIQEMAGEAYVFIQFMPGEPEVPVGPEVVCNNMVSTYTSTGSLNADILVWVLDPPEAGTLTPGADMVDVDWDDGFVGTAYLSVYGSNDCGNGPSSPELEITVNESPTPEISGLAIVCEDDLADYSTQDNTGNIYTWEVSGGSITAGAGTHQITVQWGSYGTGYVWVIEDNGACSDSTENYVVQIDECTAIDETEMDEFTVYPNPVTSMLNVEWLNLGDNESFKLRIWNIHGKLIEQVIVEPGNKQARVNVANYPSGIYFVGISNETNTNNMVRFIVNH